MESAHMFVKLMYRGPCSSHVMFHFFNWCKWDLSLPRNPPTFDHCTKW